MYISENKILKFKKAFSMAEALLVMLLVGILSVYAAPVFTKKAANTSSQLPHGSWECYYDEFCLKENPDGDGDPTGCLRQRQKAENGDWVEQNDKIVKDSSTNIFQCRFIPNPRALNFTILIVGGGGGGGGLLESQRNATNILSGNLFSIISSSQNNCPISRDRKTLDDGYTIQESMDVDNCVAGSVGANAQEDVENNINKMLLNTRISYSSGGGGGGLIQEGTAIKDAEPEYYQYADGTDGQHCAKLYALTIGQKLVAQFGGGGRGVLPSGTKASDGKEGFFSVGPKLGTASVKERVDGGRGGYKISYKKDDQFNNDKTLATVEKTLSDKVFKIGGVVPTALDSAHCPGSELSPAEYVTGALRSVSKTNIEATRGSSSSNITNWPLYKWHIEYGMICPLIVTAGEAGNSLTMVVSDLLTQGDSKAVNVTIGKGGGPGIGGGQTIFGNIMSVNGGPAGTYSRPSLDTDKCLSLRSKEDIDLAGNLGFSSYTEKYISKGGISASISAFQNDSSNLPVGGNCTNIGGGIDNRLVHDSTCDAAVVSDDPIFRNGDLVGIGGAPAGYLIYRDTGIFIQSYRIIANLVSNGTSNKLYTTGYFSGAEFQEMLGIGGKGHSGGVRITW